MDTLNYCAGNTSKTSTLVINFAAMGAMILFLHFAFNLPLFADDMKLAHTASPTINIDTGQVYKKLINEISPEERAKNFDEKIRKKYPNSGIRTITSGVKHVKMTRYYDGKPVRINLVEIDPKLATEYELKPALSSTTSNLQNKRTITTIAQNTNSIVAINGTFFKPQTGVPLGTLMIDGKMYTGPIYDRVSMGIFENGYAMARVQLKASISAGKTNVKINNINQPRMLSTHVIAYTRAWGATAPATPKYGIQIAVKDNKVITSSTSRLAIPDGGYVLVGPSSLLKQFTTKNKVEIDIGTNPNWENVKHIVSGGPYLVKNSEVFVDMTAQKLGAIGGKNPRSAIGYTADGDMILVAVDGREGSSVGMTLMQLANFMKAAGCVNAMNLDGGGSTVMYVNGQVVNNPAFKGGIAISNALVLSKKS